MLTLVLLTRHLRFRRMSPIRWEVIVPFLLSSHHLVCRNNRGLVIQYSPMQIRLWETDRNRVEMIPSHLYEDFPSKVTRVLSVPCIFVQGQSAAIYVSTVLLWFFMPPCAGMVWTMLRSRKGSWILAMGGLQENETDCTRRVPPWNEGVPPQAKMKKDHFGWKTGK